MAAVQGSVTANEPHLVFNLNTTGRKDVVVAYALRDLDAAGTNNALQPVAVQYRLSTTGPCTNVPTGFVADANGAAPVQVRLITANASGQDEWTGVEQLSLTGTSLNSSPVSTNDPYAVNEDTNLTIASPGVLQNDSDVDNDTLTVSSPRPVSGPSSGTLTLNANGSFSCTPDANFTGSDSVTYRASDNDIEGNHATVNIASAPATASESPASDREEETP